MLIEFSVENYTCFRTRQTLSMAAAPRLGKKHNLLKPQVKGEKLPDLLKTAAIYGANATGKSNLLNALQLPRVLPEFSADANKKLPVSSFRFDPYLRDLPSHFTWHFCTQGQRYLFKLALTEERIISEKLFVGRKSHEHLLYSREYQGERYQYQFAPDLEGGEVLHTAWRNLTSPRHLFLQQAVINSSEELQQLRMPWDWLQGIAGVILEDMPLTMARALDSLEKYPDLHADFQRFIQQIDIPLCSVTFPEVGFSGGERIEVKNAQLQSFFDSIGRHQQTKFTQRSALGEISLSLFELSSGTRNLIVYWVVWRHLRGLEQAKYGLVLIDEFDSSLHPSLVRALLQQYLHSQGQIQLIFNTHDTHLMDAKLLRRDQFWLTGRDENGAATLHSIHDFGGRESEDIEKRYYEGRYRGLPIIRGL